MTAAGTVAFHVRRSFALRGPHVAPLAADAEGQQVVPAAGPPQQLPHTPVQGAVPQ
ncbi:hypothetical protein ACTXG6_34045 [Pseudonocardia sp. Cha107L01]|uniref:hypothetical protein n=1 Tax=Pseudonocardia sp. Cha107L01 TaxID=3457576 RepID=UPI00403EA740